MASYSRPPISFACRRHKRRWSANRGRSALAFEQTAQTRVVEDSLDPEWLAIVETVILLTLSPSVLRHLLKVEGGAAE